MTRRVKQFIDISDFASLDDLIAKLQSVRDSLPGFAEAELRMKGDDIFGRKLSISFMREQTSEEAHYDERYGEAIRAAQQRALNPPQEEPANASRQPADRRRRAA